MRVIETVSRKIKICWFGWARWLTSVILALWEAEAGGSQGQKFKTTQAKMVKPLNLNLQIIFKTSIHILLM